jgi:predicted transcriptional regulator
MTNTNTTTRPLVKAIKPELYAKHTFHMKKAEKFTYNYAVLDDYIVENYAGKSIKQIASDMNEYHHRVQYRVTVLETAKLIKRKRNTERGLLVRQRKVLVKWIKEVDSKLQGVA